MWVGLIQSVSLPVKKGISASGLLLVQNSNSFPDTQPVSLCHLVVNDMFPQSLKPTLYNKLAMSIHPDHSASMENSTNTTLIEMWPLAY
jgi:hypothetical protein